MDGTTPGKTTEPDLRLDLLGCIRAPRWVVRMLRARPWKLGLLAFSVYYLAPLVVAASSGTLVSPQTVAQQFEPVDLAWLGGWLSHSESLGSLASSDPPPLYYAGDLIHLAMAVTTLLLGTLLIMTALQRFETVFAYLVNSGQLGAGLDRIEGEVRRARQRSRCLAVYGLLLLAAALLTAFMVARTQNPNYQWWWGHQSHGPAGFLFAMAAGAMVAGGGGSIYLLAVALQTVSRLLRYPVTLRPLHPDGCNGFAPFGDFLIFLFFLSITIATSISITFWGGYLGVEVFLGTWIVGASILLAIPLILITPLVRCTLQIARARQARLVRVEAVLNKALLEIEDWISDGGDPGALREKLEHLIHARTTITDLYGSYNFPFKPRIAGALSLSYLLQVAFLIREAISKFWGGP